MKKGDCTSIGLVQKVRTPLRSHKLTNYFLPSCHNISAGTIIVYLVLK